MQEVQLPMEVTSEADGAVAVAYAILMVAKSDPVAEACYEVDPDGFWCESAPTFCGTDDYVIRYKKDSRWRWSVDPVTWSVENVG